MGLVSIVSRAEKPKTGDKESLDKAQGATCSAVMGDSAKGAGSSGSSMTGTTFSAASDEKANVGIGSWAGAIGSMPCADKVE
jgi:hypothetical protein